MPDQISRLENIGRELKAERAKVDPRACTKLYSAVAMADDQVAYAVRLLKLREQQENLQQGVMFTGEELGVGEKNED